MALAVPVRENRGILRALFPHRNNLAKQMLSNKSVTLHRNFNILWGIPQGRVVRQPINANPGLKVNRSINFSCIKMSFTVCFVEFEIIQAQN